MSRLILVLGMHRSGTSLVTAGLQCLGVALGDKLMGASPDNLRGFFEDYELMQLDDAVLRLVGSAWDDPRPIPPEKLREASLDPIGLAAMAMMRRRLAKYPVFGFKDPRLCRLLPFWRPILDHLGCAVSCLFVYRDAEAIAKSLLSRNGMDLDTAERLIAQYLGEREDYDYRWPTATVRYEQLIADTAVSLRRIAHRLDLPFDGGKACDFANNFVVREMNHA